MKEDQEAHRAAEALCRQHLEEQHRQIDMIEKLAAERGLLFEDAANFWFDKVERFAARRGLRVDDAISVWLKEKEAVDDGKE